MIDPIYPVLVLPQPEAGRVVTGDLRSILTPKGVNFPVAVAVYAKGLRRGRRIEDPLRYRGFVGVCMLIPHLGPGFCAVTSAYCLLRAGLVRGGSFVYTWIPEELVELLDHADWEYGRSV